ncbi:MAG: penicillin acylase family protein [Acidobacteriota bacterium]
MGYQLCLCFQEPVHVYRNSYGIPHIYAHSTHDLYFVQGYVHGQDRLWQTEVFRRTAQGQLAEIGGKEFVELAPWDNLVSPSILTIMM